MRRLLLGLAACYASFYVITTDVQAQSVLITYNNEQQLQQVTESLSSATDYDILNEVNVVTADVTSAQLDKIQKHNPKLIVEKDTQLELLDEAITGVDSFVMPWNLQRLNMQDAWDKQYTGKNVKIAIIDTGINQLGTIKSVKKHLSFNPDDLSTKVNEADLIDRGHENIGHGTAVASIITSKHSNLNMRGIAPDAELYSLKYTDGTKKGEVSNLVKAINWAIENNMDVINISSGLTSDITSLHTAIQKAAKKDIIVVASAGNDGQLADVFYPARYDEVISVGSINKYLDISSFSNNATPVTFTAPGESINTYSKTGALVNVTGTSFAAPHITGLFAILKERYPYSSAVFLVKKAKQRMSITKTPYLELDEKKEVDTPVASTISNKKAHQVKVSLQAITNGEWIISLNNKKIAKTNKKTYTLKNLNSSTTYKLAIRYVDANGNYSKESVTSFKTKKDVTPPSAPTNFTAYMLESNKVSLSWKQNKPGDFSKTLIYENGIKIATTTDTSYMISTKTEKNKRYEYKIVSVDTTGNRSEAKKVTVIRYK